MKRFLLSVLLLCSLTSLAMAADKNTALLHPGETVYVRFETNGKKIKFVSASKEKDEAAHRMVIDAKGKDKRGNGTAGAMVTMTMSEAEGGTTEITVDTDLQITGKAAQFGRGNVIKDVSDKLLGQFVDCLRQRLDSPDPAIAVSDEPSSASGTKKDAWPVSLDSAS